MLHIGEFNTLKILRDTRVGLFLGSEDTQEDDVLLPNKYVPKEFSIGDDLTVFIYLDHEERPVATTLKPYVYLYQFAFLEVKNKRDLWKLENVIWFTCTWTKKRIVW